MLLPVDKLSCYEYWLKNTEKYGDYACTEHWGKKVSKSEFLRQIDGLAAFMQKEYNLKPKDVYTVFLPTTIHSFAAFYALNKIGIIINFIHPLTPPEQLKKYMDETGSKGIMIFDVTSKKYIDTIIAQKVPVIVCSSSDYAAPLVKIGMKIVEKVAFGFVRKIKDRTSYATACKKYADTPTQAVVNNGAETAVYLNGGGTTGQSKTIKLNSTAINEIVYRLSDIADVRRPGEECGIVVLPLFHAFGLAVNFHLPFCFAGRAYAMENFNAKTFNKIMIKNDGNFVFAVGIPVMFRKLMAEKNFDGKHLRSMRVLYCGGDDIAEKYLDEFNGYLEKYNSETKLMRGYGLTEVASVCSLNTEKNFRRDSIGKALPGVKMEIWDENHKRVAPGTIGEIAITGVTLMQGYFGPGLEEDAGLYTDENGTKWCLSGDLGYEDEDGFFFFQGRKKRLIIISGYNVYPGDIESLVENRLPYIKEVCAVQGFIGEKPIVRLFISLLPSQNNDIDAKKEEIKKLCADNLSQFSIPTEIVVMSELPRTPMKKIDFMKLTEQKPKAG